jgi:hypothetical protein
MCLGDKPGRAHTQEAKAKIDEIENQAAKPDAANIGNIVKPPHHRRINGTDKRHCYIGQKNWP